MSPSLDGARADGGPVRSGGNYLVGEKGPEIFTPSRSGKIVPNDVFGQISGSGSSRSGSSATAEGATVHVQQTFNINGVGDAPAVAREAARIMDSALKDAFAGGHWNGGYRVA